MVFGEEPVPPVPAEKIVDTNGAGDAFAGGFMYGILQGKSLGKSAALGIFAAADVIQHEGFAFDVTEICGKCC